ncbi:MAG TPA: hypothetical protein VFO46_02320 [Candidatus Sulfotelmatobacter sp.]|nr:hypothetical protein [Candidatus Sulfotelmatobacter sp.]
MIARKTPLKRSPLPARRTRISARRSKPRRVTVERDSRYLRWLTKRACIACLVERQRALDWNQIPKPLACLSDPCHTTNNGMSSKGPDSSCIPLCREHHVEQHNIGLVDFAREYDLDLKREAELHYEVYRASIGEEPL